MPPGPENPLDAFGPSHYRHRQIPGGSKHLPHCLGARPACAGGPNEEEDHEIMARRCELTGKGPMTGNNVSHAHNKTRRRFLPNLNDVSLMSEALGRTFRLRISAAALRTVDHRGGLDSFLSVARDTDLSDRARRIKRDIEKAGAA